MNQLADMSFKELLLSDRIGTRWMRHLAFWAFWGFYFGMVRFLNPMAFSMHGQFPDFFVSLKEAFTTLLPQTFLVYPLIYFVLPHYVFRGKYVRGFLWAVVFWLLTLTVNVFLLVYIKWHRPVYILPLEDWLGRKEAIMTTISMAYLSGAMGALTGAALAVSFKMFKHYYVKDLLSKQLQKENVDAQIRLLMAQIHPHFLFNTLNNIYSQAQDESPGSAKMLMELSHILRYILDEGKKDKVPLENEIQMLKDYIHLERVRYDEKLDIHTTFPENTGNVCIAPLLLLPFIENCFKHGASRIIEHPWISLTMTLDKLQLKMKLVNGKKQKDGKALSRQGTGIANATNRLDLLYKNRYSLEIVEDKEVFIVNLRIDLERIDTTTDKKSPEVNVQYAGQ